MSKTFDMTFMHGTVKAQTLITVKDDTLPQVARAVAKRKIIDTLLQFDSEEITSEMIEVHS